MRAQSRSWLVAAAAAALVACQSTRTEATPTTESARPTAPAAPAVPTPEIPQKMSSPLSLQGYLAVLHEDGDTWKGRDLGSAVPVKAAVGDRLHIQAMVGEPAHLYVIAKTSGHRYHRLATQKVEAGMHAVLGDAGHTLTQKDLEASFVFLVAAREEQPWFASLDTLDCSALATKEAVESPSSPCDHLHNLTWEVQPRPRSINAKLPIAQIHVGDGKVPAARANHQRSADRVAVEFQLKPLK